MIISVVAVDHLGQRIVRPLRPIGGRGWARRPWTGVPPEPGAMIERWETPWLIVLSALELAEFRGEKLWQYHISISALGRRATDAQIRDALTAFALPYAEEDNHLSGIARNFWRICALPPDAPQHCECKETEETVVESDGYTWQRDRALAAAAENGTT